MAPERILKWGHRSGAKVGGFHFFGSKSTISRSSERFCDGQYSLVCFLFAVLLLTVRPRAQPFVKVGARATPLPHGVRESAPLNSGKTEVHVALNSRLESYATRPRPSTRTRRYCSFINYTHSLTMKPEFITHESATW